MQESQPMIIELGDLACPVASEQAEAEKSTPNCLQAEADTGPPDQFIQHLARSVALTPASKGEEKGRKGVKE